MENFRNKQFISFKVPTILNSMIKSHTVPPAWDMNHHFVWCIPPVKSLGGCLCYQIDCHSISVLVFK